jgi:cytochrome c biogenesis protein CcdA
MKLILLQHTMLKSLLLLVLTVSSTFAFAEENEFLPLITNTKRVDMGIIKSGFTRSRDVTIKNNTPDDISILYISTECDCSVKTQTSAIVPAMGEYNLPVTFIADSKENEFYTEVITLLIDHPDQKEMKLTVQAHILGSSEKTSSVNNWKKGVFFFPTGTRINITSAKLYGAYFHKPGCFSCDQAREIIQKVKKAHPNFVVNEYDITRHENVLLCQRMGQSINLPSDLILLTPILYFSKGALLLDDITEENIEKIIQSKDSSLTVKPWKSQPSDENSIQSLVEKGSSISAIAVIFAGLLDGINPCAFATLIFFISFLQFMKRTKFETALIGLTFTLAVFLTYLAVGLGLFAGIKPLLQFRWVTLTFYTLSGLIALGLAIFSFRDAYLISKGKIREMSLQLSDSIKKRIHTIISDRSRRSSIVGGAFVTGFFISLLELGCTGQVYLPVITFILQVPELRTRGILLLVAYNAAFILPLLVVFVLVFFGTTWQKANKWFLKNLLKTKVLLGLLFLVLAALIFVNLFGNYILRVFA